MCGQVSGQRESNLSFKGVSTTVLLEEKVAYIVAIALIIAMSILLYTMWGKMEQPHMEYDLKCTFCEAAPSIEPGGLCEGCQRRFDRYVEQDYR